LVVLISGGGTTLRNLIEQIASGTLDAKILHVISSNADARGVEIAALAGIPTTIIEMQDYPSIDEFSHAIFAICREEETDLVAMGGFLKLIRIPADFQGRVVNIHPALLPQFGGAGFYGRHVHAAVLASGAKESGCTVHFVDDQYDHGPVILQKRVPVIPGDTPETLAARVFAAECEAYPEALRLYARGEI
jgi:formyltetrahydrofolate-dependent phosphoribosylglycinamide formyltransferase